MDVGAEGVSLQAIGLVVLLGALIVGWLHLTINPPPGPESRLLRGSTPGAESTPEPSLTPIVASFSLVTATAMNEMLNRPAASPTRTLTPIVSDTPTPTVTYTPSPTTTRGPFVHRVYVFIDPPEATRVVIEYPYLVVSPVVPPGIVVMPACVRVDDPDYCATWEAATAPPSSPYQWWLTSTAEFQATLNALPARHQIATVNAVLRGGEVTQTPIPRSTP